MVLRTASRLRLLKPALQRPTAAARRLLSSQPPSFNAEVFGGLNGGFEGLGADLPPSTGLSRNPNMSILGLAAADGLADARLGDPALYGSRPAEWWTGKAPAEVAGWVTAADGRNSHLTSLPQLNLSAACTREQVMDYFDNTWTLTEQLFASLQGEAAFYLQPYHQLRESCALASPPPQTRRKRFSQPGNQPSVGCQPRPIPHTMPMRVLHATRQACPSSFTTATSPPSM